MHLHGMTREPLHAQTGGSQLHPSWQPVQLDAHLCVLAGLQRRMRTAVGKLDPAQACAPPAEQVTMVHLTPSSMRTGTISSVPMAL